MEEKLHHVVLGEELGHRCQFIRTNLATRIVNLFLALRLPVLVCPPESVIGAEALRWKGG